MAYVLAPDKQLSVIHLLCEGNSIRSTERLTGVHRDTIMRLLVKTGGRCRDLLDRTMRGLVLRHIELDEIWTFVHCKQKQVPVEERRDNPLIGDQYLFVAIDQDTKLIPTFALGKRTGDNARRFCVDLAKRLRLSSPHQSDDHAYSKGGYRPVVQISSDAWAGYPEAIDLAFANQVLFGTLNKDYRNADQPGRYAPPEMIGSQRRWIIGDEQLADKICTSYVERNNLTIRTFIRRFTRLSLGFSKKLENLAAAVALHVAHYNFCRKHSTLRATPAMASGVTNTLWSLGDLIERSRS